MNEPKSSSSSPAQKSTTGTVLRISGTIVDVQFPPEATPDILNELLIQFPDQEKQKEASIEVAQQLGDGIVRCIALENIAGIYRGLQVNRYRWPY